MRIIKKIKRMLEEKNVDPNSSRAIVEYLKSCPISKLKTKDIIRYTENCYIPYESYIAFSNIEKKQVSNLNSHGLFKKILNVQSGNVIEEVTGLEIYFK